jgi:hypothetical protein
VFEETNFVARMLELVNIRPHLCLISDFVGGGFSAGSAARMEGHAGPGRHRHILQLEKDATHFFNLFVCAYEVLVAKQISKTELTGFRFGFFPGVKRAVFGAQLLR